MRRSNIAFKNKTNPLEYCDVQLQPLDKSFQVDVIKTYDYTEKQVRRTEFINNQLINDHLVDINRIVEIFFIQQCVTHGETPHTFVNIYEVIRKVDDKLG